MNTQNVIRRSRRSKHQFAPIIPLPINAIIQTPNRRNRKRQRSKSVTQSSTKPKLKSKRRRTKSIGRKRKKSQRSYGQGGGGKLYFSSKKESTRIQHNIDRKNKRKIEKKVKNEMQDKIDKMLQEKDDEILAMQMESKEIINSVLIENEKMAIQKQKMKQLVRMKEKKYEALWTRLINCMEKARTSKDPKYVYMEQTDLEMNENDKKEETKLIAIDPQSILYKINTFVFGPQQAAIKKYRRWRIDVVGMIGSLTSFGVIAHVMPPCIRVILQCYFKPLGLDGSQIKVPSEDIIRHWIKHHIAVLNKLSINYRLNDIGKKEVLTAGHDESSIHSNQFNVAAVSYKNAHALVNRNNQLLNENEDEKNHILPDGKEDINNDIDYTNIELKYARKKLMVNVTSTHVHEFDLDDRMLFKSGVLKKYVYEHFKNLEENERESKYVQLPMPNINHSTLNKICIFLMHPRSCKLKQITPKTKSIEDIVNDQWYVDYLVMEQNDFINLYRASIYLMIVPLIDLLQAQLTISVLRSFARNETDEITIEIVAECISNGVGGEIQWDNMVRLVTNENAVRMDEADEFELDIKIPHRICKEFKYTLLDVADATDGTTKGAEKTLRDSFTKFNLLNKLHAAVADMKSTGQQGMVNAKEVTQSEDYPCVYNEKKEVEEEQDRKEWIKAFCLSHGIVGVSESLADAIDAEYEHDKSMGIIIYESKPRYVTRDCLKFFTSKMDGIKYSLETPFEGHLYDEAAAIGTDKWLDPSKGMHKTYPGQREPYAYKLGGRSWNLIDVILRFLGKVEFAAAPTLIKRFQSIQQSPELAVYLHVLVVWSEYYIEPLKNFRVNFQTDQFQALSALILSDNQQKQMLVNNSVLLHYILGITNTVNKLSFNHSWEDQKLSRYGPDLNYLHIISDEDAEEFVFKFIEYDNIYEKYCINYKIWMDIAFHLMQLKVLLLHFEFNQHQFNIIFTHYIVKIIDLFEKTKQELPGNLYFFKRMANNNNSLHWYIKLVRLFKMGIEAARHRYKIRLINRGVDWKFIMAYMSILKLITSTNDLLESLIGALKKIFFSHTYYDYKQCGEILSFARNETYKNVLQNEDLYSKAEHELFNEMPSFREQKRLSREKRRSTAIAALALKIEKNKKELDVKEKRKERELQLYNRFIDVSFGDSRNDLLEEMKIYIQDKRNKYAAKLEFMMNRIRKFKYCTNESFTLNSFGENLEDVQQGAIDLCIKYNVWEDATEWNAAKNAELARINAPISLFNN
eukprot:329152_1